MNDLLFTTFRTRVQLPPSPPAVQRHRRGDMNKQVIINSLRIGAREYKIEWCSREELMRLLEEAGYDYDEEMYSGAALHREQRLVLCDDLKKSALKAFETLWHERMHVVEDMGGIAAGDTGGWEEELVDMMGNINASIDIQSGIVDLDNIIIGRWDFAKQKDMS